MALSAKAHNFIFTVLSRRHLHCPHCYRPLSSSSSPLPTATRPPVDPYRGHFAHPGQSSRVIKKPTFPNLSSLQETNANFFFDSENQLTDLRSRSRIWDPPVPQECPRSAPGVMEFSTFPNPSLLQETNANFFLTLKINLPTFEVKSRIPPGVPQECPRSDGIFHFPQPLPIAGN